MNRKYIALHKKSNLKLELEYEETGVLLTTAFVGERWTEKQISYAIRNLIPITENAIAMHLDNKSLEFEYMRTPSDLSFKTFWDTYDHKVGRIVQTEKSWSKLTDSEKMEALLFIEKFKRAKQKDGTAFPYPSTYLNQKYWVADKF